MRIIIREFCRSEEIELDVSENITVGELKEKYYRKVGNRRNDVFLFDGQTLRDSLKLSYYNAEDLDVIVAHPSSRGGGGHICPYGCGREIPDNYKGCTQLLRDYPDYFK